MRVCLRPRQGLFTLFPILNCTLSALCGVYLFAAVMNAHSGEVIKKSFMEHHKSHLKLTDSQITLHWISNEERALKQWVRNRVVEIRRITSPDD